MEIADLLDLSPDPDPACPDSGLPDLVTSATLADWLGLTAARVNELARSGVLPREPVPGGWGYPIKACVRAHAEHARTLAARRQADPDLAAAKLALTEANAAKVELQNARARGGLLDAQTVRAEWLSIAADLRARLLAIPSRVAAAAALDRPAAAALDAEMRRALADLAGVSADD